jgi:hypothetical protein
MKGPPLKGRPFCINETEIFLLRPYLFQVIVYFFF